MPDARNLFDLTGKTACITGASAGLGVVFANALADAGANVVLGARRVEALEALAAEINGRGGSALAQACDVTDEAQVEALVAAAVDRFGRLDVMVANAGSVPDGAAVPEKIPGDLFRQSVEINLTGTYLTAAAAGRHMLASGGGSIIMLASIAGVAGGFSTPLAYSVSKAATMHMAKYLGLQWGDRGVRVNAIGPGRFPSEMTDAVLAVPPFRQRLEDQTPFGRLGDPQELVGPLLLLASDAGSYITGQTIMVDGGMSASTGCSPYPPELVSLHAQVMPHGLGDRILPAA